MYFKGFFLMLLIASTICGKTNKPLKTPFFKYSLETDYGLAIGLWIPTKKLNVIGNHPEIGFVARASLRPLFWKISFRGCLNTKTSQSYYVLVNDTIKSSKYFFGGDIIGINFGTEIYRKKWFGSNFSWYTGVNGFDAIRENKELNIKNKTFWSFSNGPVLDFRFSINRFILNPEVFYTFLFYKNPGLGTTDLTGNAWGLRMNFTFIELKSVEKGF